MSNLKKLVAVLAGIVSLGLWASPGSAVVTNGGTASVVPSISAGSAHSVALKPDGSLWTWGNNSYGQLGDSSTIDSSVPLQIGTGYTAFAAGYYQTVALKSGNCSALGTSVSTKTLAPRDIHLPTVPAGLTATAVSAIRIDLAWMPSVDSVGVTQYKITRTNYNTCVSTPGTTCAAWYSMTMLLPTLSGTPPETSYTDTTDLRPSTQYYYSIQACNAAGNCSAQSATIPVTTQAPPTNRVAPTTTVTAAGPINNQTITVTMTPPENIVDLWWVGVYVAAITPSSLGGRVYLLSANGGWIPFTTCASAPEAFIGTLGATLQLKVVPAKAERSVGVGTSIYVGYGIGGETFSDTCSDMLDRSTLVKAYTIN